MNEAPTKRESPMERMRREPIIGSPRTLTETAPAAQIPKVIMRHPAWLTLAASVGLALLGIYCINLTAGVGAEGLSFHAQRQAIFLLLGLGAGAVVAAPHYARIRAITREDVQRVAATWLDPDRVVVVSAGPA